MTEPRKPSLILPVAGVALLLLLAGYVGTYYAMVVPTVVAAPPAPLEPHYPFLGDRLGLGFEGYRRANWFFEPAFWLDRRVRPHVWEPPEVIIEAVSLD